MRTIVNTTPRTDTWRLALYNATAGSHPLVDADDDGARLTVTDPITGRQETVPVVTETGGGGRAVHQDGLSRLIRIIRAEGVLPQSGKDITRQGQLWLASPNEWSPHVDEIAIARALDFDWEVIRNLTYTETGEFINRLAAMDDPYGAEESTALPNDERDGPSAPPRYRQWLRGDRKDREFIRGRVRAQRAAARQ